MNAVIFSIIIKRIINELWLLCQQNQRKFMKNNYSKRKQKGQKRNTYAQIEIIWNNSVFKPNISINTLNVSGLNASIKDKDCQMIKKNAKKPSTKQKHNLQNGRKYLQTI